MTHHDTSVSECSAVPRRIFGYWDKGFDNAPDIVKLCVESWRKFNPDYEFVLLDAHSASELFPDLFADESFRRSNVQVQSELLRLYAVTRVGGIWMDATVFLTQPLDSIVGSPLPDGFLAIKTEKGSNRFLQNYFLASVPSAPFVEEWLRRHRNYVEHGYPEMPRRLKKRVRKRFPFLFSNVFGTGLLTSSLLSRRLGYPYLIMDFIANPMIIFSPRWRRVYHNLPTLHSVTGIHLSSDPNGVERAREILQADELHVWKLDWKDPENHPEFWADIQALLRNHLTENS